MKFYNNSTHRTVTVKPSEVNINGTRDYYYAGIPKIALHGKAPITLSTSERSLRQQAIVANNYRKVWERKFKELG